MNTTPRILNTLTNTLTHTHTHSMNKQRRCLHGHGLLAPKTEGEVDGMSSDAWPSGWSALLGVEERGGERGGEGERGGRGRWRGVDVSAGWLARALQGNAPRECVLTPPVTWLGGAWVWALMPQHKP